MGGADEPGPGEGVAAGLTPQRKPAIRVVPADESHADALAEFFRAVWGDDARPEDVRAAQRAGAAGNLAEPGAPVPTVLVLADQQVVGYVSSLPVRLWTGTDDVPGYWVKGLMVREEYRNGPIGFMVLKALVGRLPRSVVLTVAPASRRLFAALGYRDLGAVPNYVRLLRPARVAARLDLERLGLAGLPPSLVRAAELVRRSGLGALAGGLAGALLGLRRMRVRPAPCVVSAPVQLTEEVADEVWSGAKTGFPAGVVRNGAYLLRRYGSEPERYRALVARRDGHAIGLLVLRTPRPGEGDPRLQGITLATVADACYPSTRPDVGAALLREAARVAVRLDADALLCTASAPTLVDALRRETFFRLPGNVHFFHRDVSDPRPHWPDQLVGWWLTRGDGQSDEVF